MIIISKESPVFVGTLSTSGSSQGSYPQVSIRARFQETLHSAFQISDVGLEAICYSLKDLEDVNLCETPIGERGVEALTTLNKLRIVNLNSTKVTMDAYCKLKVGLRIHASELHSCRIGRLCS